MSSCLSTCTCLCDHAKPSTGWQTSCRPSSAPCLGRPSSSSWNPAIVSGWRGLPSRREHAESSVFGRPAAVRSQHHAPRRDSARRRLHSRQPRARKLGCRTDGLEMVQRTVLGRHGRRLGDGSHSPIASRQALCGTAGLSRRGGSGAPFSTAGQASRGTFARNARPSKPAVPRSRETHARDPHGRASRPCHVHEKCTPGIPTAGQAGRATVIAWGAFEGSYSAVDARAGA